MRPDDFPLDGQTPFSPTATYYLRETGNLSSSCFTVHEASARASLDDSERAPTWVVSRASLVGRSYSATAHDTEDVVVASMQCPTWSFGRWAIEFADHPKLGTAHHPIEVRPVGMGSKDDMFVVDSVPFFWQLEGSDRKLRMVRGGKRIDVGEFEAKSVRDTKGLLKVNTELVDGLVAVMTLISLLKRLDSFRK